MQSYVKVSRYRTVIQESCAERSSDYRPRLDDSRNCTHAMMLSFMRFFFSRNKDACKRQANSTSREQSNLRIKQRKH